MDSTLLSLIQSDNAPSSAKIDFADSAAGRIDLVRGEQRESYLLKPLGELYGSGTGGAVDPQNESFLPLFLSIEEEITRFDESERRLTDAEVSLALNTLGLSPEAPSGDLLIQRLQFALRLNLSLNNYSRTELRQAIRRVGRSVDRHTESGRGRGYLNFIQQFFGKMRK